MRKGAWPSAGAFVCGGATLKKYLINRARTFLFNTALPPYFAEQIRAATGLARGADAERARLAAMSARLREDLRESGWNTGKSASQIVPVLLGENDVAMRTAAELGREGFAVRAIRPPTVAEGTARLRLSLNCTLKDDDLTRFARAMTGAREMVGAISSGRDEIIYGAKLFHNRNGTGVGKTVLSALLCAALEAAYWKPIQTGTEVDSDSETVQALAGLEPEKIFPRHINLHRPFRHI